jgi:hypothetical protein
VAFGAFRERAPAWRRSRGVGTTQGRGGTAESGIGRVRARARCHVKRIGFDQRAALLAADPGVYYVTDHCVNYPTVLVRLSRIHRDALRDLLGMAWLFVSAKKGT